MRPRKGRKINSNKFKCMAENNDPQFTLVPLGQEEGELAVAKFRAFFKENGIDLVVSPIINKDGTIGAKAELFKKLELVPKGVVSPIQAENLGEAGEKTA